jgi:2-polyprenyl-6-methoxyphenol hydroxylase-like FAD-dependent oxidoreductase
MTTATPENSLRVGPIQVAAHMASPQDPGAPSPTGHAEKVRETGCCIVGGGPAGVVLALLLARQAVDVTLLEGHHDFNRDFRGDTIHPSTLELMDQLGLIDRLLELPHTKVRAFKMHSRAGVVLVNDRSQLKTPFPYTVVMPQVHFLEFIAAEAARYPWFHLVMGARVEELIEEEGEIKGVRYRTDDHQQAVYAPLTVAADGRFSKVRQLAGITVASTAQTIDALQFRLPRRAEDPPDAVGYYVGPGQFMVLFDRGPEWQISRVFPKGGYQQLRAAGLQALRDSVAALAPWLADRTGDLKDWKQTSMLAVESGRVDRWYRPGLLLIGDAAHVMSPVGGVGINLAIQDAVAASNLLGRQLKRGQVRVRDLAGVQRRREWPTRLIQHLQDLQMQQVPAPGAAPFRPSLQARLVQGIPLLNHLRTRLFAFGGLQPERVQQ